jgi:transcriptional regulator with XRE-family HTH domain
MTAKRRRNKNRLALYDAPAFVEIAERLAENLRVLRDDRGWTQEHSAELCELPFQTYQPLEYAKTNFTAITLSRLCAGFEVDVSELLGPTKKRRVT